MPIVLHLIIQIKHNNWHTAEIISNEEEAKKKVFFRLLFLFPHAVESELKNNFSIRNEKQKKVVN